MVTGCMGGAGGSCTSHVLCACVCLEGGGGEIMPQVRHAACVHVCGTRETAREIEERREERKGRGEDRERE